MTRKRIHNVNTERLCDVLGIHSLGIIEVDLTGATQTSASGELNPRYGQTHTDEAKQQIAKSLRGVKHAEARRKNISESLRGRKLSADHVEKMAASRRGKPGKPHTEESKAKMSEARTGIKQSEETKEKRRQAMRSKIWVTDGVRNMRVESVPEGWVRGRTKL